MTRLAWLPQPLRSWLRVRRDALRRSGQQRALLALAHAPQRRIIIGSSGTFMPGWVATDQELIDLLVDESWRRFFAPASLDAILAEHVWEHLSAEQGRAAAATCHRYLKPGGYLRVAVPDGLHPEADYLRAVRPPADGHRMLYTHASFSQLFRELGFDVRLYEYFDEAGRFHFSEWRAEDGMVRRSRRFDPRNSEARLGYTSIVLDAVKRDA
ncbi:class I SAM-dependent methyltransferase [Aquabacterium sp.]|uniref:class I SAM-dependent methyltransferase n=1 Tax=Aquabacterium sp. TaxID=1872578 RepID=UPI0037837834